MQLAVSPVLLETIKEVQSLQSLSQFALAGGTNLALRYNHRQSQDIDLFCPEIVGVKHFESIEKEVVEFYGVENITGLEYPAGKESEQHTYLRFWVTKPCGIRIKVEIIQNMKMTEPVEIINDVRMVSTKDIGLFKLISGSSRAAKKDIYDLDFITDKIELTDLFELLELKKEQFKADKDKNIFDLDEEDCPSCPIKDPYLLLKFDGGVKSSGVKPMHANDNILIVGDNKSWIMVGISWRRKVRRLFAKLGVEYPM